MKIVILIYIAGLVLTAAVDVMIQFVRFHRLVAPPRTFALLLVAWPLYWVVLMSILFRHEVVAHLHERERAKGRSLR